MKYKIFYDKCVISHVFSFLPFLFSHKKRNQFYPHHIPIKIKNVGSSQIFDVFLSSKKEMKMILVIRFVQKKLPHHLIYIFCFKMYEPGGMNESIMFHNIKIGLICILSCISINQLFS